MASVKASSTLDSSGGKKPSRRNLTSDTSANSSSRPSRKACANVNLGNNKPPSCPLVMIEWEDSAQPIPSWTYLASFVPTGTIRCASVGWLIRDDDQMKAVAPNMGGINDERSLQVSGVIQIPTSCVLRVTLLSEPMPL
jgi:hypothetical protein